MNVVISEKLIEDPQRIDSGIRRLQNKLSDVIDGITDNNADPVAILQKYKDELAAIKTDLVEFLDQQKEFDRTVENAEKEISTMSEEVKKMLNQHNIHIDENSLEKDPE